MKTLLGLLSAVLSLQCVTSQISMVESGPGIMKPAETLDMTCKVTGASLTDSANMHCVHWVRQLEGGKFQWLGSICYNNYIVYGQSVQGRITLSRDTNKEEVYLKLTGVKLEESGKYYCARGGGGRFDVWGNGQSVVVSSATQQAPSLFPLISCGQSQDAYTTIGCLARDYFPEDLKFTWADKSNNSFTNGLKTSQSILYSGAYLSSSQVQVTTDSWVKREPYYCSAKHSQNSKTVAVVNPGSDPTIPNSRPVVTIHAPSKEDIDQSENATIVCLINDFYPNEIKIKWLKNHVETSAVTEKANENANGRFTVISYITVSKLDWDRDTFFSCVVDHPASGSPEIRNLSKSLVCEPVEHGEIQVTAVPPSYEDIYFEKKAPLTCLISNIGDLDGLLVSWYEVGSEHELNTTVEDPIYKDNAYTVKAIARVCADDWLEKKYKCIVKHGDLTSPKTVYLAKENGQKPQPPTVLLMPPHQDDINRKEKITITCLIKNFYPKDFFAKWSSSDNVIENSNVVTTEPMLEASSTESKKSYFAYSTLTLESIEDWNNGKSYTCTVGHESLPLQATQKTIDKTTGKPTSVNVSLVMSDSC